MPGLTRELLQQLARTRLQEVRSLLGAGHFPGAWYIGGYVLELGLKAAVCQTLGVPEYPEAALGGKLRTHLIEDLVLLAGLQSDLALKRMDADFAVNWSTVTDWKLEDRYKTIRGRQDVIDLLLAYEDSEKGVFPWLTSRW